MTTPDPRVQAFHRLHERFYGYYGQSISPDGRFGLAVESDPDGGMNNPPNPVGLGPAAV